MKPIPVKHFLASSIFILMATSAFPQKEFFRPQQVFTKEQMSNFYSSITIHEELVIFNANDYQLYAYNKKYGSLKWSVETNYKSVPWFLSHEPRLRSI